MVAVENKPDAIEYVKLEYRDICLHLYIQIEPNSFTTLPDHISPSDFTDPITLDSLEVGKIYGFLVENEKWYIAGSLESINGMIENKFRGSSKRAVFIPIKNELVETDKIIWVKL